MKKAIVIGASSGIGRALAKKLSTEGYAVGITGRRLELLQSLAQEIGSHAHLRAMDASHPDNAVRVFQELAKEMGGVDLVVYNAGVDYSVREFDWKADFATTQVNALGFVAIANTALLLFIQQNSGHLVCISSIAGIRSNGRAPAYSASKAYMSNYLYGLRQKTAGKPIYFTDIRPGYVRTDMIKDRPKAIWCATPEEAAAQICEAIRKKKRMAYVTRRWWLIAQILRFAPDFIYDWGFRKAIRKMQQA
jgi:short-subunit dehydrogenase